MVFVIICWDIWDMCFVVDELDVYFCGFLLWVFRFNFELFVF